jgi:hypothetical protein
MMVKGNVRRRALTMALALALAVAAPLPAATAGQAADVYAPAAGGTAEMAALAAAGRAADVYAPAAGGTVTVPAGETALRVPVSIADIGAPCAGVELALSIEGGGGLSFTGFSAGGGAAGANVLGPTSRGGVAYFGFYAGGNIYTEGELELRFSYTGDARHSVAVAISQIIRLNADRDGTSSSNVGEALLSFDVARETGSAPGDDGPGGNEPGENNPGGTDPGGDGPGGSDPGGSEPGGSDPGGSDPDDNEPSSPDPGGNDPGGSDPSENNPGGGDPGGNSPGGNPSPASPSVSDEAETGSDAGAETAVAGAFTDIGDDGVAMGAGEEPAAKTRSAYFDDVDESWPWAVNEIDSLYERGVVKGTAERTYSPAAPIKRGDFMLMLARAYSLDAPGGEPFSDAPGGEPFPDAPGGEPFSDAPSGEPFPDVPAGSYYYAAIHSARALGVAQGDGEGFKPESPITRQDMMALADRALRAVGNPLPDGGEGDLAPFGDSAEIAGYARASVSALVKSGLIKGRDTGIAPREATTRAEMAVLVHRMLNELQ